MADAPASGAGTLDCNRLPRHHAPMYELLRPLLFRLDAETAHGLTLRGLDLVGRSGMGSLAARPQVDLPVRAFGIDFPNPVGLAAGLDKDGRFLDALGQLGFGFIEIGTVTPRPQPGNPRPRLFRLPAQRAIINRMGFNNAGVDALVRRIERSAYRGVLGINIGRNKDTPNEHAPEDYLACMERVYPLASYITVNISSPNTQGLRDLQQAAPLKRLVGTLRDAQEKLAARHGARKPMLLKIAPDLDAAELDAMAEVLLACHVDGVICTNTTIAREGVAGKRHAHEPGGLSGGPLFAQSTAILRGMAERLGKRVAIIGVGGILEGADAALKRDAGATLVQIYSGLVYRGPRLVDECIDALRTRREQAA